MGTGNINLVITEDEAAFLKSLLSYDLEGHYGEYECEGTDTLSELIRGDTGIHRRYIRKIRESLEHKAMVATASDKAKDYKKAVKLLARALGIACEHATVIGCPRWVKDELAIYCLDREQCTKQKCKACWKIFWMQDAKREGK